MEFGSISSVIWFILCLAIGYFLQRNRKRGKLPPGPFALPLIGNLHQLDLHAPHVTLDAWGKKFGSVYTLWLGNQPNVVITDPKMIRSVLTGKDADALAGRPNDNRLFRYMSKGRYGVILLDGEEWREQRRFSLHILRDFGFGRSGMEERIQTQVSDFTAHLRGCIEAAQGGEYEASLAMAIQTCVGNIINTVVYGSSYPYDDPTFEWLKQMLEENFRLVSTPQALMIQQSFWLRHLPLFRGTFKALAYNNETMSQFLLKDVRRIAQSYDPDEEPTCYTESYLQEIHRRKEEGKEAGHFSEWQLTMITGDMWAAGMETTVTTLGWALLYLLHHPEWQERLQSELDAQLRPDEDLRMSHRPQLIQLTAYLLEVQRLANIIPINLQHRTMRAVKVGGHVIPENTVVIPQIASVHLDADIFPKPHTFDPERFIASDGTIVKEKADQVIPFSLGKRSCLGESLARMELFLIFGSLLHNFHFQRTTGEDLPSLKPRPGVTLTTQPYRLRISQRTKHLHA